MSVSHLPLTHDRPSSTDSKATRVLRQYCESRSSHCEEVVVAVPNPPRTGDPDWRSFTALEWSCVGAGFSARTVTTRQGERTVDAAESRSLCVSAVGASQESHHFIERGDVEFSHRTGVLQPVPHYRAGIEQLKSNVVIIGPSLQKYKHAQTSAFDGSDFREIEDNDSGIAL